MKVHVVIPARYNSSRLPGKPLLEMLGRPMIWHVYQRAVESGFDSVIVATDDERISSIVEEFGGKVVLTNAEHESGTDRLAEVADKLGFAENDVVVNLQGDEPLVPPSCVNKLADVFNNKQDVDIATLSCPIEKSDDVFNPNVVKVVTRADRQAMYFSRAPIPWHRGVFDEEQENVKLTSNYERHIGMYAYRTNKLKTLSRLPVSALERLESLEQLRALESGMSIYVERLEFLPPHGVDTYQDYEAIVEIMRQGNES